MKITLKHGLLLLSGLLGVIAFMLMFAPPLALLLGNVEMETFNMEFTNVYFGKAYDGVELNGAGGAFVGYLFILLGSGYTATTAFVNVKHDKYISLGASLLMLIGSILVLCTRSMWISANKNIVSGEIIKVCAAPIVAGIFGILSCFAGLFSKLMVGEDDKVKKISIN